MKVSLRGTWNTKRTVVNRYPVNPMPRSAKRELFSTSRHPAEDAIDGIKGGSRRNFLISRPVVCGSFRRRANISARCTDRNIRTNMAGATPTGRRLSHRANRHLSHSEQSRAKGRLPKGCKGIQLNPRRSCMNTINQTIPTAFSPETAFAIALRNKRPSRTRRRNSLPPFGSVAASEDEFIRRGVPESVTLQ